MVPNTPVFVKVPVLQLLLSRKGELMDRSAHQRLEQLACWPQGGGGVQVMMMMMILIGGADNMIKQRRNELASALAFV